MNSNNTTFMVLLAGVVVAMVVWPIIEADEIDFEDCGHQELKKLLVTGCHHGQPICIIHKGDTVTIEADFVANQNTTKVELEVSAHYQGLPIKINNLDSDACKRIECPLVKGKPVVFKYKMPEIPKDLPNIENIVLMGRLIGEQGLVACAKVTASLED